MTTTLVLGRRNPIHSASFFSGGNALFTVSHGDEHYTYKIRQADAWTSNPLNTNPYFVYILSNPTDYTYLGRFDPALLDLQLTKASKMKLDSTPVRVIRWIFTLYRKSLPIPEGYAVQHEGRCCKCGRTLTTPESIDRGIGPVCAEGGLDR